jgi:hypothetical protein
VTNPAPVTEIIVPRLDRDSQIDFELMCIDPPQYRPVLQVRHTISTTINIEDRIVLVMASPAQLPPFLAV